MKIWGRKRKQKGGITMAKGLTKREKRTLEIMEIAENVVIEEDMVLLKELAKH